MRIVWYVVWWCKECWCFWQGDGRPFWRYAVATATGCADEAYFEELYQVRISSEAPIFKTIVLFFWVTLLLWITWSWFAITGRMVHMVWSWLKPSILQRVMLGRLLMEQLTLLNISVQLEVNNSALSSFSGLVLLYLSIDRSLHRCCFALLLH